MVKYDGEKKGNEEKVRQHSAGRMLVGRRERTGLVLLSVSEKLVVLVAGECIVLTQPSAVSVSKRGTY